MIRTCRKALVVVSLLLLAFAAGAASAQMGLRWLIANDKAQGGTIHAYGADPSQTLMLWPAKTATSGSAPLILFVHGGGWKRGSKENATGRLKTEHYPALGYAFASIDYRLVPDVRVEDQASDVAHALAWAIANAARIGIDPRRIILMGHSAGAQLVALVGTDPRYLRAVGLDENAIAGVVPIDGAAYDVARQVKIGARLMGPTYEQAFGTDPLRQTALSPTLQAAPPNAPAFLILHVQRRDGIAQSRALAEALRSAGTRVDIADFPGFGLRGHIEINRRLGDPDYPATPVVDQWLKTILAR